MSKHMDDYTNRQFFQQMFAALFTVGFTALAYWFCKTFLPAF